MSTANRITAAPRPRRLQGQHRRCRRVVDRVQAGQQQPAQAQPAEQVEIYEAANQTSRSIQVVFCCTQRDQTRVAVILKELGLADMENVIVIDDRSDNKPSASKA
jgi:hypothetical protein